MTQERQCIGRAGHYGLASNTAPASSKVPRARLRFLAFYFLAPGRLADGRGDFGHSRHE